jgi:3-oxoacyl-[acyl-carrier protein] reductase
VARDAAIPHGTLDDAGLRGSGAHDRRGPVERSDACDEAHRRVTLPLVSLRDVVREHDEIRADHRIERRCARHAGHGRLDGPGLADVERLTRCDTFVVIDEGDGGDYIGCGELPRDGTAEIAGANDDCRRHGDYSIWMNRSCLVTGGTRGIGYAVAEVLLAHGDRVAITGTSPQGVEHARQKLSEGREAGAVAGVVCDVRDPAAVEHAMREVVSAFGGLDVLVNNAGVGVGGTIADMTLDEWNRIIDTNLTGVFHCSRAAIPHLRARGGGWIINVSSLASKNPFVGGGAYCASKTALNALSEVMMQELRYDNIRVSYVLPGSVATGFSGRAAGTGMDWKLHGEDVARAIVGLLEFPARSLPSRVEIRPSRPSK